MSKLKRYEPCCDDVTIGSMDEKLEGDYVKYADYARLKAAANERIAELERIITSIKLADREKADSLNSYRVDLETAIGQRDEARMEVARLSAQVTDET